MKFIVAHLGARRHYALPMILQKAGMLEHFFTDIYPYKGFSKLLNFVPSQIRPAPVKRLLGRQKIDIPSGKVTAFTKFGLEYFMRRYSSQNDILKTYLWAGKRFCNLVLREDLKNASGVYTFNSAGLELLVEAKKKGLLTVMEQTIASFETLQKLLEEERIAFPDWDVRTSDISSSEEYISRERAEWGHADLILCGSEFVRTSIDEYGGPVDRCIVVPYGIDSSFSVKKRTRNGGPLRVLTVGSIGLRKGAPYVLTTAKLLEGLAEFRMIGPINLADKVIDNFRKHVEVIGPIPRSKLLEHYEWADVFLLPSLCEGSAIVCYEALSCGLPVITTPNAGSIVREGIEGFIVPIRDPEAIAEKLQLLINRPELLESMGESAMQRSQDFTIENYGERLIKAIKEGLIS
ncbi:MAG: glycosyltransferase family 4 protein [Candidatus Dadabacteria bacterium]|nr:glycosyltransferase family 4 protein [Candidatus Dadabacteria bacterium]